MYNDAFIESRHDVFSLSKNNYHENILAMLATMFDGLCDMISKYLDEWENEHPENTEEFKKASELFINDLSDKRDVSIFLDLIARWLLKNEVITFGIEYFYIDRDFRDSYYLHYSEKHKEIDRYCKRVFVFIGNHTETLSKIKLSSEELLELQKCFAGTIVATPLPGRGIGRTLLNPIFFFDEEKAYIRKTEYTVHYKGYEFKVTAFPFRMQDNITTTCAEITIANTLDYYSMKYNGYQYMVPSDIHQIVKQERYERHIPSQGIPYQLISRVFYLSGFAPKLYYSSQLSDVSIKHLISYYVESGIPVSIGAVDCDKKKNLGHSIVVIGHGEVNKNLSLVSFEQTPTLNRRYINSADLYSNWIVQDDQHVPYSLYNHIGETGIKRASIFLDNNDKSPKRKEITFVVAPLYKRMYMDAIRAQNTILTILDSDDENYSPYTKCKEDTIIFRLFLASSRHLKAFRISKITDLTLCQLYQETPLPQFIWVCELYRPDGYKRAKAFGEIVLDATYSGPNLMESCLMINYPDRHLAHFFNGASMFQFKAEENENKMIYEEAVSWVKFDGPDEFDGYTNLSNKS